MCDERKHGSVGAGAGATRPGYPTGDGRFNRFDPTPRPDRCRLRVALGATSPSIFSARSLLGVALSADCELGGEQVSGPAPAEGPARPLVELGGDP